MGAGETGAEVAGEDEDVTAGEGVEVIILLLVAAAGEGEGEGEEERGEGLSLAGCSDGGGDLVVAEDCSLGLPCAGTLESLGPIAEEEVREEEGDIFGISRFAFRLSFACVMACGHKL